MEGAWQLTMNSLKDDGSHTEALIEENLFSLRGDYILGIICIRTLWTLEFLFQFRFVNAMRLFS